MNYTEYINNILSIYEASECEKQCQKIILNESFNVRKNIYDIISLSDSIGLTSNHMEPTDGHYIVFIMIDVQINENETESVELVAPWKLIIEDLKKYNNDSENIQYLKKYIDDENLEQIIA